MIRISRVPPVLPLLLALSVLLSAPLAGAQDAVGRELFAANCALCHGEKGDGKGTASLDRLARSFVEGGFSYGNTASSIQRTVTYGIPGTPMPSFGEALNEDQIAQLTAHVIELGPGLPPEPKDTELVVGDLPLVVRGMLPPISASGQTHPRGLLIGTPDGFIFEYSAAPLRLLGMRQGRFVDRTDWIGRGGTALKPLGPVVLLEEGGAPRSTFVSVSAGKPLALTSRLRGTRIVDNVVWVRSELLGPEGEPLVVVEETIRAERTPWGNGYLRRWRLRALDRPVRLGLREVPRIPLPNDPAEIKALRRRLGLVDGGLAPAGLLGGDLMLFPVHQLSLEPGQEIELRGCRLRLSSEKQLEWQEVR